MPITYKAITSLNALDYEVPEIDVAYFDSYVVDSSLSIIEDVSYCHRVVLANIDISANVFKKLFYDQSVSVPEFNTLTNSYEDHTFGLLQPPGSVTDVSYTIFGESEPRGYYGFLSKYISLLPPARTIYQTGDSFFLHDQILDNIIADLKLATFNPSYEGLFETCSVIKFNNEITRLKTLNDVIKGPVDAHCALTWNSILEMVRGEYADVDPNQNHDASGNVISGSVNNIMDSHKYAILMMTLVFKTTMNLGMGVGDNDSFVSTTEVKLRYKMDFAELEEFQETNAAGDLVITM
jgi:hypothetical protein